MVVRMLDIIYVCPVKKLKLALLLYANCLVLCFLSSTLTLYYRRTRIGLSEPLARTIRFFEVTDV